MTGMLMQFSKNMTTIFPAEIHLVQFGFSKILDVRKRIKRTMAIRGTATLTVRNEIEQKSPNRIYRQYTEQNARRNVRATTRKFA